MNVNTTTAIALLTRCEQLQREAKHFASLLDGPCADGIRGAATNLGEAALALSLVASVQQGWPGEGR